MSERMELLELEMDNGEVAIMAAGVHDPEAFRAEVERRYGQPGDYAGHPVEHKCMVNTGPKHGFDDWWEPVRAEPNHTIMYF